jgi:hypothetical protein
LHEVLLSKTNQFLKGNNVLYASASNIDGFLWRVIYVSSTQLIGLLEATRAYLHLDTSKVQEVFISKTNSILTGKPCYRCCSF